MDIKYTRKATETAAGTGSRITLFSRTSIQQQNITFFFESLYIFAHITVCMRCLWEDQPKSNISYFLFIHNVMGRCWWYVRRGLTYPLTVTYNLIIIISNLTPYNYFQKRKNIGKVIIIKYLKEGLIYRKNIQPLLIFFVSFDLFIILTQSINAGNPNINHKWWYNNRSWTFPPTRNHYGLWYGYFRVKLKCNQTRKM